MIIKISNLLTENKAFTTSVHKKKTKKLFRFDVTKKYLLSFQGIADGLIAFACWFFSFKEFTVSRRKGNKKQKLRKRFCRYASSFHFNHKTLIHLSQCTTQNKNYVQTMHRKALRSILRKEGKIIKKRFSCVLITFVFNLIK